MLDLTSSFPIVTYFKQNFQTVSIEKLVSEFNRDPKSQNRLAGLLTDLRLYCLV